MAHTRELDRFEDDARKVDFLPILLIAPVPRLPGFKNLLDRANEPVRILEHDSIEVVALLFADLPVFQRFQIQANGGDRRLKFVCYCIQETVLLIVFVYFSNQENGVNNDSRDDQSKKDDPQNEGNNLSPVDYNPGDVKRYRQPDQDGAQRHK